MPGTTRRKKKPKKSEPLTQEYIDKLRERNKKLLEDSRKPPKMPKTKKPKKSKKRIA